MLAHSRDQAVIDMETIAAKLEDVAAAKAALETRVSALEAGHRVSLQEIGKLEEKLAEALTLVAPFGGGDLLVGIRHLQRSLEREIEEHQRHHDKDEEREHLIQSLRHEVDDGHEYEDKLEAKLKAARELLAEVIDGVDAGRISITVGQENRIRAALAASGTTKEGTTP
jgi:chromosome segregation ATPase